jgi:aspartyl-tRNA(Asn)/glutamyl-tRNA(Gln) amidotransferase subunit C
VANLARLEFDEVEIERFTSQMSALLEYVEQLGELDLDGVEPTAHVHEIVNALRADQVRPSLGTEAVLSNAPQAEEGCFKVEKVIDG